MRDFVQPTRMFSTRKSAFMLRVDRKTLGRPSKWITWEFILTIWRHLI